MTRIDAIRLLCPDPAVTAGFYRDAFKALDEAGETRKAEVHRLMLGEERLELATTTTTAGEPRAPSLSCAFQHCAIVVADMDRAMAHLSSVPGWQAISSHGPERLPERSGGVTAFKFRDPDGHPLELIAFPPGAVPPHWRRCAETTGRLFLGIDHTAVTVTETRRSLAFYVGLGFAASGGQINEGPEQERLDGVPGAVVEVTTLRTAGDVPPHLELLCYRRPEPLAAPAPDGSVLATLVRLVGSGLPGHLVDPDGHRLERTADPSRGRRLGPLIPLLSIRPDVSIAGVFGFRDRRSRSPRHPPWCCSEARSS